MRRKPPSWPEPSSPFQSTHSVRSAARDVPVPLRCREFQSTHSVRSAAVPRWHQGAVAVVSIHALREECGVDCITRLLRRAGFQSTHSVRSAAVRRRKGCGAEEVSIHALREECGEIADPAAEAAAVSIHALREECGPFRFLCLQYNTVSIHALREECGRQYHNMLIRPCPCLHFREPASVIRHFTEEASHQFSQHPYTERTAKYADLPGISPQLGVRAAWQQGSRHA